MRAFCLPMNVDYSLSEPALRPLEPVFGAASHDTVAEARVKLCYLWRHHRAADLRDPRRFTEFVQWRKLFDRSPGQHLLMDKIAAKKMAGRILGREWTVPTLWHGARLPDEMPFPAPAIVKARHGCNQNRIVREAPTPVEWKKLQALGERWCAKPYGTWLDEFAYRDVQRGIVAEPLLGKGPLLPVDYKIYVFGGVASHVQVHLDRENAHRWILHDRDFVPLLSTTHTPARPRSLAAMLDAAEALADGRDFLRVDFYEVGGAPLFGEFCLYPGSGLDPFAADWIDIELGSLWRDARAARHVTVPPLAANA